MARPPKAVKAREAHPPPSDLVASLGAFARLLQQKEHVLATLEGDEELASKALSVTKDVFDIALQKEQTSHPLIHNVITSLLTPAYPIRQTRQSHAQKSSYAESPSSLLPSTPLGELYVDGMEEPAIWAQMDLREKKVTETLKVLEIGLPLPVDLEDEKLELPEEEEGSDEEMTPEEMKKFEDMLASNPEMFREWEEMQGEEDTDEEDEEEGSEEEDDEDDEEELNSSEMDVDEDENDLNMEDDEDLIGSDEELADEEMDMDDDLMEDDEEEEEDDEEEDLPGPSRSKPNHPTLDDQFFSIDAFNKFTEESEASNLSSGKLGGSKKPTKGKGKRKGLLPGVEEEEEEEEDDEEDEVGLDDEVGDLFGGDILNQAGDEGDNMMYSDFFAPPREWTREKPGSKKDPKKEKAKGKGKAADSKKPKPTEPAPAEDIRDTISRVRTDLFADDDEAEESAPTAQLSSHEKRQLALQEQIAVLEQENVGKKDWTLLGEAKSKDRPQNSLLEEDLDFEQMGKVVPIVTEDKVMGLEEIIKRRILDDNFDDVVRRRELDDKAFIPSRYFELENSESSRSLAQIYEDEYKNASGDGTVKDVRDVKLAKDHEEIDQLWGEICYKLDALSNLNFTPKQPKAAITTLSNVATASMENALPTTQSTSTMLAPEELFAPASKSDLVARSELDPLAKKRMRQKDRKTRMRQRQALDSAVDKYAGKAGGGGKARGGVKSQKDRALKELVKTGKGVTVVGKESVKKPRGKGEPRESISQSSTLKL